MSEAQVMTLNTEDPFELIRDRLRDLMTSEGLTQNQVAREAHSSGTAVSQFLSGKYNAKLDAVADRLSRWMDGRARLIKAAEALPCAPGFVLTPSAERVLDALTYAHMAADIVIIYGGAGLGKTITLNHYAQNNPGTCIATITPATASVDGSLEEIASCLGIPRRHNKRVFYRDICDKLRGTHWMLIVDEAQQLTVSALDQIRQLQEAVNSGLALVGNEQVYTRISGGSRAAYLDRLYSRVGKRTHLKKPLLGDVNTLCSAWKITDKTSRNFLRDIAAKPGGLRGITKTVRLAHMLANGEDEENTAIMAKHLRAAWNELWGEGL